MLCEKIIGRIEDSEFIGKPVDFVEIDWHETYNKILRKLVTRLVTAMHRFLQGKQTISL